MSKYYNTYYPNYKKKNFSYKDAKECDVHKLT